MSQVTARRRLSDLYALGIPLTLDDGATEWEPKLDDNGDPVTEPVLDDNHQPVLDDGQPVLKPVLVEVPLPPINVWVAKLSDIEMSTAMKKAAQAQAALMAARKNHDSDDWQALHAEMGNLDSDVWTGILCDHELIGRREIIEARIAGEPVLTSEGEEEPSEWAKDGYLEGLRDAWLGGLNATYAADPGDPDAVRVLGEIERFNKLVDDELAYERDIEMNILTSLSDDLLLEKVTDVMIESEGQSAWSDEYRLRCIFLSARQCDGPDLDRPGKCLCRGAGRKHTEYLFDGYDEVCVTDGRIRAALYAAFNAVMVDVREGKGSRATATSSTPSESPAAEETSTSFGPTAVTA